MVNFIFLKMLVEPSILIIFHLNFIFTYGALHEAEPGEFPFAATILSQPDPKLLTTPECMGGLIAPNIVLSACLCFQKMHPIYQYYVTAGTNYISYLNNTYSNKAYFQMRQIEKIEKHKSCERTHMGDMIIWQHDLALVYLNRPFVFISGVIESFLPLSQDRTEIRKGIEELEKSSHKYCTTLGHRFFSIGKPHKLRDSHFLLVKGKPMLMNMAKCLERLCPGKQSCYVGEGDIDIHCLFQEMTSRSRDLCVSAFEGSPVICDGKVYGTVSTLLECGKNGSIVVFQSIEDWLDFNI